MTQRWAVAVLQVGSSHALSQALPLPQLCCLGLSRELPELLILSLENVEVITCLLPHASLTGGLVNEHLLMCGNKCCKSAQVVVVLLIQ